MMTDDDGGKLITSPKRGRKGFLFQCKIQVVDRTRKPAVITCSVLIKVCWSKTRAGRTHLTNSDPWPHWVRTIRGAWRCPRNLISGTKYNVVLKKQLLLKFLQKEDIHTEYYINMVYCTLRNWAFQRQQLCNKGNVGEIAAANELVKCMFVYQRTTENLHSFNNK